jgi:hypothetical protein
MDKNGLRVVPGMERYVSDLQIYKSLLRREKKRIIQEEGGRACDLHDRAYRAMTERYGMVEERT